MSKSNRNKHVLQFLNNILSETMEGLDEAERIRPILRRTDIKSCPLKGCGLQISYSVFISEK